MESALQARSSGTIDPLCFEKAHATLYHVDAPVLPSSSLCSITTSAALRQTEAMPQDPSPSSAVTEETQEEESLVDSQPICFKENPFLVANRKGKGRPLEERILSGPPTGYGRQGHLQTLLYNKASNLTGVFVNDWCAWTVTFLNAKLFVLSRIIQYTIKKTKTKHSDALTLI